jgi:hypothetical protein
VKDGDDDLPAVGAYIPADASELGHSNAFPLPFGRARAPLGHVRPIILERPTVTTWGPIIRARYETPRAYTSWCVLLSVPFTGGRAWFDFRFKKFDKERHS